MKLSLCCLPLAVLLYIAGPSVSADEIGPAIKDVPIFDAHVHYKEPAWE